MEETSKNSSFAPAERLSGKSLEKDILAVSPFVVSGKPVLDAAPALLMILNSCRQIVFANKAFLDLLGAGSEIFGKRPGEALKCVHSEDSPGGCGEGEACKNCGAVLAIMECLESKTSRSEDCRLLRNTPDGVQAVDLKVSATHLNVENRDFVVFAAVETGGERRRNYLENVFLHEVRNSAGDVMTLSGLLKDECGEGPAQETASMLVSAASRLMSEIDGHRMLIAAETGVLKPEIVNFSSAQLLQRLASEFSNGPYAEGKKVEVSGDSDDCNVSSDTAILGCALGNLIRNALEASKKGELVKLECKLSPKNPSSIVFSVWNKGAIDREIQTQIFHRSFSTKGSARGIGCYASRLLVERFLDGSVSFSSSENETVFSVEIPVSQEGEEK